MGAPLTLRNLGALQVWHLKLMGQSEPEQEPTHQLFSRYGISESVLQEVQILGPLQVLHSEGQSLHTKFSSGKVPSGQASRHYLLNRYFSFATAT